jgi:DNA-binding transcriptional regulator YhcF (GntR family)
MAQDELKRSNRQAGEQEEKQRNTLLYEDAEEYGWILLNKRVLFARNLSSDAVRLYSILKSYAYQKNHAFPGYETLCQDMQVKRDAVRRYMKELETAGLIEQRRRGLGLTNVYILKSIRNAKLDVPQEHLPESENKADDAKTRHQDDAKERHLNDAQMRHKEIKVEESKLKNQKSNLRKANAFNTEKGGEGTQAPAHSHLSPMTTGKQTDEGTNKTTCISGSPQKQTSTQKPVAITGSPKHPTPVYIGKPLTQEEIDEKRRHGQNASGYTPLSQIPPSHWQELKTRPGAHPTNGNGNGHHAGAQHSNGLHYSESTTHAPDFIDALIEQFSKLLHDEAANIPQNINRAAKLYRQSEASEELFIAGMHDAYMSFLR